MTAISARINLRVSEDTRDIIDRAAKMQGLDRTAFMLDAAVSRAREVIFEDRLLNLSPGEVEQVRELLANAPAPTPVLRSAAKRLGDLGI